VTQLPAIVFLADDTEVFQLPDNRKKMANLRNGLGKLGELKK